LNKKTIEKTTTETPKRKNPYEHVKPKVFENQNNSKLDSKQSIMDVYQNLSEEDQKMVVEI